MVSGRRSSFEDELRQRVREFEYALEQQRVVIARETQQRLADIERAAIEELEILESATADKTAEIHWAANEQREALDQAAAVRSAEFERAAREERAAFEALAGERFVELDNALRARFQALRAELVDEAARTQHTALERIDQARSLLMSDAGRLAQAVAPRDEARQVPGVDTAVSDEVMSRRILEFQKTVREQIDLIDELDGLQAAASERLDEARALTAGALRGGMEGLRLDIATVLRQPGHPTRTGAAVAQPRGVFEPAAPVPSRPRTQRLDDDSERPPIHWTLPEAPPDSP
jgi:hypothetical protein